MNNSYFPGGPLYTGGLITPDQGQSPKIEIPFEQSYIENILRANRGKKVTVYTSFSDSVEWKDKDHILLSDPTNGKWYMILMIYVDFIEFDERINYEKI